jgi:hypothetical protein
VRRTGWLALALIAPALAACGGDDDNSSTPVEKPPLTVPGDSTAGSADTTDTDSTEATPPDDAGDTGSTTGPADQPNPANGGVPAPDNNNPPADQQPEDSPSNDTPPEPGSPADRFEQFCAQNPGAC